MPADLQPVVDHQHFRHEVSHTFDADIFQFGSHRFHPCFRFRRCLPRLVSHRSQYGHQRLSRCWLPHCHCHRVFPWVPFLVDSFHSRLFLFSAPFFAVACKFFVCDSFFSPFGYPNTRFSVRACSPFLFCSSFLPFWDSSSPRPGEAVIFASSPVSHMISDQMTPSTTSCPCGPEETLAAFTTVHYLVDCTEESFALIIYHTSGTSSSDSHRLRVSSHFSSSSTFNTNPSY